MSNYKKDPITIEEFAFLQKTGRLYVGFVAGLGYAHVKTTAINPLNFNGYSHIGNLPLEANKFTLIKGQYINNDPEIVRKSLEKTVSRQVRLCTVKQGDTITLIAKRYGVSVDSIVKWNQLPNQDKIDVGQKLIVSESLIITESDKKNSSNNLNDEIMSTFVDVSSGLSLICGAYVTLPKNSMYLDAAKNSKFITIKGGEAVTRSTRYYGNGKPFESAADIAESKRLFDSKVTGLKIIGRVGTTLGVVGTVDAYNKIATGNAEVMTYPDAAIGTVSAVAEGYSFFSGAAVNPYIAIGSMMYFSARFGWDMGKRYGISKWPQLYREYQERKKSEELRRLILESFEKNNK